MKAKKMIVVWKFFGAAAIALLVLEATDIAQSQRCGSSMSLGLLRYSLVIIVFMFMLSVFFSSCNRDRDFDDSEYQDEIKRNSKLKWSTLYGPCTWELAKNTIDQKANGGWRLPTVIELMEHKTLPNDFKYWISGGYVFRIGSSKDLVATLNVTNYFYLVRDI